MIRILTVLAGVMVVSINLVNAQQPASTPIALPKPILAKLPAMASWTIIISSRQPQSEKEDPGNAAKRIPIGKKAFIKTEPLMEVVKIDGTGHQFQQWRVGDTQYLLTPGSAEIGVIDPTSDEFIRADFQDLGWIKQSNLIGMQRCLGKKCWVFKDKVLMSTVQELEEMKKRSKEEKTAFNEKHYYLEKVAYVDSMTQLPVLVQQGEEMYAYSFGTPPTAQLTLPANLQRKVQADQQRIIALKAGPPRPF